MKLILIIVSLYYSQTDVDISKIAGKTQKEVERILGSQTKRETYKPIIESDCECERVFYLNGKLSIVYIENKADLITISSGIKIINLHKVKIREFHTFGTYNLIKTISNTESQCCFNQSS